MRNVIWLAVAVIVACEQPPPQGPQELTYQNGYAQTTTQGHGQTTYQNGYAQRSANPTYTPTGTASAPLAPTTTATATEITVATAAPVETAAPIQTVPIPLGVATLPPPMPTTMPTPTATATTTTPPGKTMATPGNGAFQCTSDAQCLLGRCNVQYRRCAYPCKSSELDCKAGNVCSASGLCMPRGALGM